MKIMIGIVFALLAFIPLTANAQGIFMCHANLGAGQVVPPTDSPGGAQFDAMFAACAGCYDCQTGALEDSLAIILNYQLLAGSPTGAAIYVGQPGSNGIPLHVISADSFAATDTLHVRIAPEDCSLLENGSCYVTIATDIFPDGELRGQLSCGVSPTVAKSWGVVRTLIR